MSVGLAVCASKPDSAFDVKSLKFVQKNKVSKVRKPANFSIFDYVQTTHANGTFTADVALPPKEWAFGRVIMKIWIHGGRHWDDATPHIKLGTNVIKYLPDPYEWSAEKRPKVSDISKANHNVASFLILYKKPDGLMGAPIVSIFKVGPNTSAHKAGLKVGDYIYSYDGVRVYSRDDVQKAKQASLAAGKKTVTMVLYRGIKKIEVDFPTGQMGVSLGVRQ